MGGISRQCQIHKRMTKDKIQIWEFHTGENASLYLKGGNITEKAVLYLKGESGSEYCVLIGS